MRGQIHALDGKSRSGGRRCRNQQLLHLPRLLYLQLPLLALPLPLQKSSQHQHGNDAQRTEHGNPFEGYVDSEEIKIVAPHVQLQQEPLICHQHRQYRGRQGHPSLGSGFANAQVRDPEHQRTE